MPVLDGLRGSSVAQLPTRGPPASPSITTSPAISTSGRAAIPRFRCLRIAAAGGRELPAYLRESASIGRTPVFAPPRRRPVLPRGAAHQAEQIAITPRRRRAVAASAHTLLSRGDSALVEVAQLPACLRAASCSARLVLVGVTSDEGLGRGRPSNRPQARQPGDGLPDADFPQSTRTCPPHGGADARTRPSGRAQ
jgi:hypothetical protein